MTAGRPKITNQIKELRGTDQPCRVTKEIETEKIKDISSIVNTGKMNILKSARSKKIFKEKANQLIALKVLTEIDFEQLAIYSNNLDMLFTCMADLKKEGHFTKVYDEDNLLVRHVENPNLKLYKDLQPLITKLASEFGFTPISRMKFAAPKDDEDPLTKLLKQFG